jgi:hypothetical protein
MDDRLRQDRIVLAVIGHGLLKLHPVIHLFVDLDYVRLSCHLNFTVGVNCQSSALAFDTSQGVSRDG